MSMRTILRLAPIVLLLTALDAFGQASILFGTTNNGSGLMVQFQGPGFDGSYLTNLQAGNIAAGGVSKSNSWVGSFTGNGAGLNNVVPITPNTNQTIVTLSTPLSVTNPASFFAYGTLYSNRVLQVSAGQANPGFQPVYGGTYYGLTVANDPTISQTNYQAALGYKYNDANIGFTNKTFNFYDGYFDGGSGNSVWLGGSLNGTLTNTWNWFNCTFKAGYAAFNPFGIKGALNFYGCVFDVGGNVPRPNWDDATIGFEPDQGPLTNRLYGCLIRCRDGATVNGYLGQINSYTIMYGCTIEVSSTNTSALVRAVQFSGEGNYSLELDSCHVRASGGSTNLIIDLTQEDSGVAANTTLILNNTYWDGATGPIVVKNNGGTAPTLIVSGGNFLPSHFSDPSRVTWLTPQGVGLTNQTTTFTGVGSGLWNVRLDAANLASNTIPIGVEQTRVQQLRTNYVDSVVTNSLGQSVGNGMTATNDQRALTLGGLVNVGILNVTNNITNGVLTASRVLLTDANKALVSAAGSGAVPIDADGTATTIAQLQNLGVTATNDQRALTLGGANNTASFVVTNGIEFLTNSATGFTPQLDMSKGGDQFFFSATNFSIALANVPTLNTRTASMVISNTGANASTILVTLTGFCAITNGSTVTTSTFYVTNVTAKNQITELTVRCRSGRLTNAIVSPFYDK